MVVLEISVKPHATRHYCDGGGGAAAVKMERKWRQRSFVRHSSPFPDPPSLPLTQFPAFTFSFCARALPPMCVSAEWQLYKYVNNETIIDKKTYYGVWQEIWCLGLRLVMPPQAKRAARAPL